jgi:argininosuccinate synthase
MKKVVLAYSGGLDTSICIPLLRERYGYDYVISVIVDVSQGDLKAANDRGGKLSDECIMVDAKEEFVQDCIFPLIKANGDYEGYAIGTSASRPLIARKIVEVALQKGANAIAHGCTGKGNDQLRFESIFRTTNMDVIAPIRELNLTREEERAYAIEHGIAFDEKRWSIDENLWNRSIEGDSLEDPSSIVPEEAFKWTKKPEDAPNPETLEIEFEEGMPIALNGERLDGEELVMRLNELAGEHGIGRVDIMEDRVLGLKSRENYEQPAATVLILAHKDLERLVLTRNELRFKENVDKTWSELVYQGLTIDPLFEDLNAFIEKTQERVTGKVKVKLFSGNATVIARESPYALYSKEVSFDEKTDQRDAGGYSKYHSFQSRLYEKLRKGI